ncbi:hypothetical protein LIT38_19545 [Bacillus sp. CMF12]|uniref:hypothetical protein n=1 Tax=Bacillaceae TaxID=186817 RepID=UPI001FB3EE6A|nr:MULTISPECIES: hypothetical protein [Bacillaceae]UOE54259.1 hypothetical protein IRB79_20925 [Cytobacillus oceanisediminis]USK48711.1 hypothetical protein LIT38_19545 [Bacillus sp. CMF12]
MKESKWSDEQLQELLSQMPKIKDDRDPKDIYQAIEIKMGKQKNRTWILPSIAAAAALLLLFILVPNLMSWQESADKQVELKADRSTSSEQITSENNTILEAREEDSELNAQEKGSEEQDQAQLSTEPEAETNDEISEKTVVSESSPTAVYEEDLAGKEVLTYAIPDKDAQNIVPVSVLIDEDPARTKFEQFEDTMSRLTEVEWGLDDYYPLKANFTYDQGNKMLTVDVPADHPYSISSTTELLLEKVLANIMNNLDIEKINLMTEGEIGIDFSHYGYREEFIPENSNGNLIYYFLYPNGADSTPFLVPLREQLNSIKEALIAMKQNRTENNLQASIPEDIDFETEEIQDGKLLIRFNNESEIIDDKSTLHAIEAILLTAKDFDFDTVKLENADVDKIGKFDLTEELKVPVAANKRDLPN